MIELIPENLEFQINTTGVEITYSEQEGLSIQLTVIKDNRPAIATILFPIVAEFECVGMNFYESKHEDIKIFPSSPRNLTRPSTRMRTRNPTQAN